LAGSNEPLPSGTVYQSPPLHLWRADMVVVAVSRVSRDIGEDAHIAKVLTEDEARRIASNSAKLPTLLGKES
jgi:hypothetical protein